MVLRLVLGALLSVLARRALLGVRVNDRGLDPDSVHQDVSAAHLVGMHDLLGLARGHAMGMVVVMCGAAGGNGTDSEHKENE